MKNFLKKQREAAALIIYVAVIAALSYLAIFPLLDRIGDINDQIQQEMMRQESVKSQISELPKTRQQYQALENDGNLDNILLDKNKAVVLIEKLENLAGDTKNKITIAIQETAPVKKTTTKGAAPAVETLISGLPSPDYLQMKITLLGDYGSIAKFVGSLEKFEYYSDITSIQIGKEDPAETLKQSGSSTGLFGVGAQTSGGSGAVPKTASGGLRAVLDTVFYTN